MRLVYEELPLNSVYYATGALSLLEFSRARCLVARLAPSSLAHLNEELAARQSYHSPGPRQRAGLLSMLVAGVVWATLRNKTPTDKFTWEIGAPC